MQSPLHSGGSKKDRFTSLEDEVLREEVKSNGTTDWAKIASALPGRSPRQCRDRWANYINPTLIQREWTIAEDQYLLQKYNQIGPHWRILSEQFIGRSINSVRNRLLKLLRKIESTPKKYKKPTGPRAKLDYERYMKAASLAANKQDQLDQKKNSILSDNFNISNYQFDIFQNDGDQDLEWCFVH